ncbi:hypothetical protein JCM19231_684 [Vibrio ishigakensis]|uniref:Uncharacterized protein n=1 Tax=Vibrio ishigakensis TaxID=1481914 RepID=A0A0B8NZV9_9VIBR|nr:hypothetical protein JCM19231_684 [Vibrio ishigakensis]
MSLNSKNLTLILFSSVTLVVVIYQSLSVGIYQFSLSDLRSFLLNEQQTSQYLVFWELRLPRTLIALFGGAALATAGHIMQSVLKNHWPPLT